MTDSSTMTMNEAPRVPVVVDLEAGTIGTDTHVRPLPESADAALAAYLDLVYEMRDSKGVVALRQDDVEILAVGLELETDDVVGRLVQLMGSEAEARGLLARLRSGKVLIPAALLFAGVLGVGGIALANSGSAPSGTVGTKTEPTTIITAAPAAPVTTAAPVTAAPTTAAPVTTAAPATTAAPVRRSVVKPPVVAPPATTAPATAPAAPVTTAPPAYVPPAPYRPVGGTPTVIVGPGNGSQVGQGTSPGASGTDTPITEPPTVPG